MENDSDRTRRRLLRTAGLTAATGVLAGCLDESTTDADPGGSTDDGDDDDPGTGDEADGDDGSAADGSDGDAASDEDGIADDDSGTDAEDGETESTETDREYEIVPGTEILFSGETVEWVGLAPSPLDGVSNPTLVLEAGEQYTIGWAEGNETVHNIAIWDENEDLVDDLETEETAEPDEEQRLTFTAREEMAFYVCDPHYAAGMRGTIEVRSGE